jgi:tetratricopeptide (TPR) repeat protein
VVAAVRSGIGLVQVGNQSMADRYSYIPYIGIFISLVWLIFDCAERYVKSRKIIAGVAVFFLVGLSFQTWRQAGLWKNSVSLYEHTLNVTKKNEKIHFLMGMALTDLNELNRAIFHYRKALEVNPDHVGVHNNLGVMLAQIGNYKEAILHFSKLVDRKNGNDRTHYNLALAYQKSGDLKNAELNFRKALRINPTLSQAKEKLEDLLVLKENRK